MDLLQNNSTLAWRERPLREVVRLAWPISVSMLSFSLMTMVDTLFVGRIGAAALAGVGLGGIVSFTILCFGLGMLRATKIMVAQVAGAGRRDAAAAYLGASLCLAAGIGVLTALFGHLAASLLPLLASGIDSGQYAASYTRVRTLSGPFVLCAAALRETRHGLGDARSPMRAALIGNLVNLGLVALFSIRFHSGVTGIAFATLLAQLVEALVLVAMQWSRGFGLRAWSAADLRVLLRLGVPLGFERFLDVSSFTLMVTLFARMGDVDLAAHQVANQALLLAFMPSNAIGEASSVLVGQAVGAGSLRSVVRVQRSSLVASFAYVGFCSFGLLLGGRALAGVATNDPVVIARACQLLQVASGFVWFLPIYQIGQSSLRGIGDVRAAAAITVFAAWIATPLFAAVLGLGLGLGALGGWIGIAAELLLGGLLFWWRLHARSGWLQHARRFRARVRRASESRPAAVSGARVAGAEA
jgi:MATE family multidrug resistance protein